MAPKRIVANCPHCLHTLLNEYPAFGGNYEVIHHSQLIDELIREPFDESRVVEGSTGHMNCYRFKAKRRKG